MNEDDFRRRQSSPADSLAEHRARADEEGTASGPVTVKKTPVLGRTALATALALLAAFLLIARFGLLPWPAAGVVRDVLFFGAFVLGGGLAVVSLVRKERPRFAVVTLCLLIAGPLLFWLLTMLAWFGYAQGLH